MPHSYHKQTFLSKIPSSLQHNSYAGLIALAIKIAYVIVGKISQNIHPSQAFSKSTLFIFNKIPSNVPYQPLNITQQMINADQRDQLSFVNSIMQNQGIAFFSLLFISQDYFYQNTSSIQGSYIGIYATNIWNSNGSSINVKGQGCSQSEGYGCGFLDWIMGLRLQCGGTGASHGGMGGQSSSPSPGYIQTCLQMTSRNIYDDPFNPIFEGSGGGGQNQSSSLGRGGGVVYIESALQMIQDGLIDCSGKQISSRYSGQYYGSGSGGSIQIHTIILFGQGLIRCNGGGASNPSQVGYGGNGGGGRIKINLTQWFRISQQELLNQQFSNSAINLNVVAIAGETFLSNYNTTSNFVTEIQQQGSIITTPCLQSYEVDNQANSNSSSSFLCKMCPNGYYKFLINTGQCLKCSNNNDQGWTFSQFNSTSPICKVSGCLDSSQSHFNQELNICQYEYQYLMVLLGGPNGVFAIVISVSLFLISLFIYILKKPKTQQNNQIIIESIDPSNIMVRREESSAKTNFVVEDLPYHVLRLYLSGNNSYNKPWLIFDNSALDFQEIQDKALLNQLFQEFNSRAHFNCLQKSILLFTRYYYYPIYYLLQEYFRKRKFAKLTLFLEKKKIEALNPNQTGVFFKFSASTDFTLAYIDILNYHQDVLGWTNQTQFPVTFILQGSGTFLFPLSINLADPLLKSLHLTFQNHLIPNSLVEIDFDDKNSISSFELFVNEFNKRAKLIDFRQSLDSFRKYFINLAKFTEQQSDGFFSRVGVQIDICIHIMEKRPLKEADKSKFILVRLAERKKLDQWIEDVHNIQNFSDDLIIRFSVNFDMIRKGSSIMKEQIGLIASNNLNRQLAMYKKYEDEREQLNNLKLAMKRRIDQGEEEKKGQKVEEVTGDGSEFFYQNYSNYANFDEVQKASTNEISKSNMNECLIKLKRKASLGISYFTKFRQSRIHSKLLMAILFLVLIYQWALLLLYPLIIYSSKIKYIMYANIATEVILFPFCEAIANILLSIWVINNEGKYVQLLNSSNEYGKRFLLFNYCSIITTFISLCFGISGFFRDSEDNYYKILNLFKVVQFFFVVLLSFLACLQFSVNEDLNDLI